MKASDVRVAAAILRTLDGLMELRKTLAEDSQQRLEMQATDGNEEVGVIQADFIVDDTAMGVDIIEMGIGLCIERLKTYGIELPFQPTVILTSEEK